MSEDSKLFAKPKVRFSQAINVKETSNKLADKKDEHPPKIIDDRLIKTSVKLQSLHNKLDNVIAISTCSNDDAEKKESVISHSGIHALHQKEDDNFLQDQSIRKTNDKESSTANLEDNNIEQTSVICERFSQEDVLGIPCSTFPVVTNQSDRCKVLKSKNTTTINISDRSTKNSFDKGKENKNLGTKKSSQLRKDTAIIKPLHSKIKTQIKKKTDSTKVDTQKSVVTKRNTTKSVNKPHALSIDKQIKKTSDTSTKNSQKNLSTKSSTINVMPCYKYNKNLVKNKSSPVKKSILRDIVVSNAKTYIEPSISKQKHIDLNVRRLNKSTNVRSNVTPSEKLSYPQYNSIMCTINKLDEVKKEKIVTDIEHLPATYKDLVNGKISSALDFPVNEVIYKNLVDLSIDEKQFPSKIMRSRDPQPRQRDLVPKLSDFFIPESVDEYYTPMFVKSRNSDLIENWNASRISNKICEWKDSMDN
ncbi:hypothetical protein M0804_003763 [Polistes exclamans]|nr:hypothetical protein M0804_003763 [Polistes exclamans]